MSQTQVQNFMTLYKSHKTVHANKITKVTDSSISFDCNGTEIESAEGEAWITKHEPKVGGYYVVYKDGYRSYSPAEAFEDGYTAVL